MKHWFSSLLDEEVPCYAAAAVRITTGLIWLHEVAWLFVFHDTLYDRVVPGQSLLLIVWFAAAGMLTIGFFTQLSALICFLCSLVFFNAAGVLYHIDYFEQIVAFYLIFIQSGRCWSVDEQRRKKSGAETSYYIWNFPVLVMMFHLSTIYLDAGLCHLLLNESWREGYAISQSLIHPHWNTKLGWFIAHVPYFSQLMTYASMIVELSFLLVFLVYLQKRSRWLISAVLGVVGLVLHLGITLTLDIGAFGIYPAAAVLIFIPPHWYKALFARLHLLPEDSPSALRRSAARHPANVVERGFVLASAPIALAALLAQIPLMLPAMNSDSQLGAAGRLGVRMYSWSAGILHFTGDHRPHDVFSMWATASAFTIDAIAEYEDGVTERLPLLFEDTGERVGFGNYMRVYMWWLFFTKTREEAWQSPERKARWLARFDRGMRPLLLQLLSRRMYSGVEKVRLYYREWETSRGLDYTFTPRMHTTKIHIGTAFVKYDQGEIKIEFEHPAEDK